MAVSFNSCQRWQRCHLLPCVLFCIVMDSAALCCAVLRCFRLFHGCVVAHSGRYMSL